MRSLPDSIVLVAQLGKGQVVRERLIWLTNFNELKKTENIVHPDLLIVFMRNPVIGQVKSRLARDIGEYAAYKIYIKLIDKIQQSASAFRGAKSVFYADFIEVNDGWSNDKFSKYLQQGKNLGESMSNAILTGLNLGHEKVMLIGSDIPKLDLTIITEAFHKLEEVDVVLGPSTDGGYYLIGLKSKNPDLFKDIPWSTKKVLDATLKKCREKHFSTYLLKPLTDIDTLDDIYLLDDESRDLYLQIIGESEEMKLSAQEPKK